jgi:serine/threonine protein kinase
MCAQHSANPAPTRIGPYTILRLLGEGAMGAVFLGQHDVLHTQHALKLLAPRLTYNAQARERFLREARHSARLDHPHIVRVFNADVADGVPYIAMEYVKGRSLKAAQPPPVPPHLAVRYAYQVALALGAAHHHGIIHRNVKPDNILLTDDDMVKLTDFGLVLALNSTDAELTASGVSMGTPYFMSPEQWANEGVDHRTDIYALGVTLYHMLSKRYPFEGDSPMQIVQRQLRFELLHLQSACPEVEPGLAMITHRAIAHSPIQRFQTAEDFALALARWWQQHPSPIPLLTLDQPSRPLIGAAIRQPSSRPTRHASLTSASKPTQVAVPRAVPTAQLTQPAQPADSATEATQDSGPVFRSYQTPTPAFRSPRSDLITDSTSAPQPAPQPAPAPPLGPAQTASQMLNPIEIAPNTYWVGKREAGSVFFANPYLRIFEGPTPGGRRARHHLLIGPGSSSDFLEVRAKVERLIGGLDRLSLIFINHQDPDVGSSAAMICSRYNEHALIMTSEDTWRLIVHFNLPKQRCVFTEKYATGFSLPTGHTLLPVPSPFCHFVGAVMLYDPETQVLFSGDLFGGLTPRDAQGLWADESDWPGVRAFHQLYMPSNKALRRAVQAIRALDPPVRVIAPQHGRVLVGDIMDTLYGAYCHPVRGDRGLPRAGPADASAVD